MGDPLIFCVNQRFFFAVLFCCVLDEDVDGVVIGKLNERMSCHTFLMSSSNFEAIVGLQQCSVRILQKKKNGVMVFRFYELE